VAIKAIIFDIDGVLADSREAVVHNTGEVLAEFGFGVSREDIEMMSSAHSADSVLMQLAPVLENDRKKLKRMLLRLSAVTAKNMNMVKPTVLAKKVPNLAKRYKLAIATNRKRSARLVLKKFGIEKHFSAVQTSIDSPPKPDPAMIRKAVKKLKVKPSETIFVGDNAEDRVAGLGAGVHVVIVDAACDEKTCRNFIKIFC
jgi:phosphoglycolate phosphatase